MTLKPVRVTQLQSIHVVDALETRLLLAVQPTLVRDIDLSGGLGAAASGKLFFSHNDGVHGRELWTTDGTSGRTVLVKDINPSNDPYPYPYGGGSWPDSDPDSFASVNGTLFFSASAINERGPQGEVFSNRQLWKSDGTEAGTLLVREIPGLAIPDNGGSQGSNPSEITNVNGTVYFTAGERATGTELWKSDGTLGGTVLVKDIYPENREYAFPYLVRPNSSHPSQLTAVNGTLYFTANDGVYGDALWKSDGTEAGTVRLTDNGGAFALTDVNGTLFFAALGRTGSLGLWKSDGTIDGTVLVKSLGASSHLYEPTNVDGQWFFTLDDGTHGRELWTSDGTAAGTFLVKDINPGGKGSSPASLIAVNNELFFTAKDPAFGRELWRSDGTASGTVRVRDIALGLNGSAPDSLTKVNGTLYFTAGAQPGNVELWRTDGTDTGTELVADVFPGSTGSSPADLVDVQGRLFFTADDGAHGREIWRLAESGLVDGVLSVRGTPEGDRISFKPRGTSSLLVTVNGSVQKFSATATIKIELEALGGDDVIDTSGISIPAVLHGGEGDDVVAAGGGSDSVSGGDGSDRIYGGGGNDLLSGNAGNDHIEGGEGHDRLNGHGGHDRLFGGAGRDRLFGGTGRDVLRGQGGDDLLLGEGGSDQIFGGIGGRDTLRGNAGDDLLISNDGSIDELFGDGGQDTGIADAEDFLRSLERSA